MLESVRMFIFHRIATTTNSIPKNGLIFDANFEHPTCKGKSMMKCFLLLLLQGVTTLLNFTQGVALG